MTNANTARTKVTRSTLEKENLLQAKTERVEMTLNTDSAVASGLLIQRLTELYEDPIQASVRETVSNALDAVAENAKGDGVVEIQTPSILEPVLVIKDNGVGMSYEDLKNIYSKYGASTKMDNFDQVGAYGLGAKAPLAYGTEFTVTSVKDGEKTTVIVAREELTNYIKIVGTEQTKEANGTTVSIPVNSRDIERFAREIGQYKKYPLEKEGVIIKVDGKECEAEDFFEVTDKCLIFKHGEEEVYARIWMQFNPSAIVELLTAVNRYRVEEALKFVIGGWAYDNPSNNGYSYYLDKQSSIVVELKPGIVGFNSSRDAILNNDRFQELEKLVLDHIESQEFLDSLVDVVKIFDLEDFKSILVSVLNKAGRVNFEDNSINVKNSFSSNGRKLELNEFVHSSGFDFYTLFSGVPSEEKELLLIKEELQSYRKQPETLATWRSSKDDSAYKNTHNQLYSTTISDLRERYDEVFTGESNDKTILYSDTWKSTLLTIFKDVNMGDEPKRVIIVSDINDSTEKARREVFRSRRALSEIALEDVSEVIEYTSFIIYTSHSKDEAEEIFEKGGILTEDVKIISAEDAREEILEYRKKNRKQSDGKKKVNKIEVSFKQVVNNEDGSLGSEMLGKDYIDNLSNKDKKVFFILSKEPTFRAGFMRGVENWVANKYDLESDEMEVIFSVGSHRKYELDYLMEIGTLLESPNTEPAGFSNLYKEVVASNVAGIDIIRKGDGDESKKIMNIFLRELLGYQYQNASERLQRLKVAINEVSDILGFEKIDFDFSKFEIEEGAKEVGQIITQSGVLISDLSKFSDRLTSEDKKTLEAFSLLGLSRYRDALVTIKEDGEIEMQSRDYYIPSYDEIVVRDDLRELITDNTSIYNSHRAEIMKKHLVLMRECLEVVSKMN